MGFSPTDYRIFETVSGSHVYGTNTPESDVDYRGVVIPPKSVTLSLFERFEQQETREPDRVLYSLEKYLRLAILANPSILELLFIDPKFWIYSTPAWQTLRAKRALFLSTKVRYTFSGYAISQLKRMRRHIGWIVQAPPKPNPEDFGLTHSMLLGQDEVGAYDALVSEGGIRFRKEVVQLMSRVKGYRSAVLEWKNYQAWKEKRNPARAKLEQEFGLDLKHAYHLVRLARLGEELLTTGTMTLSDRADQDELVAIRRGEWSYEQIMAFAEGIDARLAAAETTSVLPHHPDRHRVERLYMELIEEQWACAEKV